MLEKIKESLNNAPKVSIDDVTQFFKTHEGSYGAHDKFLRIKVPTLRNLAKDFYECDFKTLEGLIYSPYNEERFLALVILIKKFEKGPSSTKKICFEFYLKHLNQVNNWNLVDASAHLIIGRYLFDKKKNFLWDLACSQNMWFRRISIISTWYFIKKGYFQTTLEVAMMLLYDEQDLIHKAVGWMLREMGKKENYVLTEFLNSFASKMPRTMLRYAIEKYSKEERIRFLNLK